LVRQLGHVPALGSRIEAVQTRSEQTAEAQRALEEAFRNATPEQTATPVPTAEAPATPPSESDGALLGPRIAAQPEPTAGLGAGGASEEPEPTSEAAAGGTPGEEAPEPEESAPVICGSTTCAEGLVCCNASCGTCAAPGEKCNQQACGMPYMPTSLPCGMNTCNVGQVCCNPSCGTCTAPGATCDTKPCPNPIQYPGTSQVCGMQTCNTGYVCCNPSCGICRRPGEPCSHEVCD
jgi:hypothetical protein